MRSLPLERRDCHDVESAMVRHCAVSDRPRWRRRLPLSAHAAPVHISPVLADVLYVRWVQIGCKPHHLVQRRVNPSGVNFAGIGGSVKSLTVAATD